MCLQVVLLDLEVLSEISSNPAGLGAQPEKVGDEGGEKLSMRSCLQHIVESRQGLNQYFIHFMVELMALFKQERQLLEDRGSFIIRCVVSLMYAWIVTLFHIFKTCFA